jgi:hypothetical protein
MRYKNNTTIKGAASLGTNQSVPRFRKAYEAGQISTISLVLGADLRLDQLAFKYLGSPAYWWAIAALSGIGWGLQLPAGTRVVIPVNIDEVKRFV